MVGFAGRHTADGRISPMRLRIIGVVPAWERW